MYKYVLWFAPQGLLIKQICVIFTCVNFTQKMCMYANVICIFVFLVCSIIVSCKTVILLSCYVTRLHSIVISHDAFMTFMLAMTAKTNHQGLSNFCLWSLSLSLQKCIFSLFQWFSGIVYLMCNVKISHQIWHLHTYWKKVWQPHCNFIKDSLPLFYPIF